MSIEPRDFLFLDKMITPTVITVIYWVFSVLVVIVGFLQMFRGGFAVITGLVSVILGPVFVRVWCELITVFFKMNENLAAMREKSGQ